MEEDAATDGASVFAWLLHQRLSEVLLSIDELRATVASIPEAGPARERAMEQTYAVLDDLTRILNQLSLTSQTTTGVITEWRVPRLSS